MKKKLWILLAVVILAAGCVTGALLLTWDQTVTVYYTNDVHCYIDNFLAEEPGLSYAHAAALRENTPNSLLLDAGDHLQGAAYGSYDNGLSVIGLMNAAGYDAATPGNHEFNYRVEGFLEAEAAAEFAYLACNFRHQGQLVLPAYRIFRVGGQDIAVVGIATPEVLTTNSPAFFLDEAGQQIYHVDGDADGAALYASVQAAIDSALAQGADVVIGLGHLGLEETAGAWTSRNVIANTTGMDALIDAHSHTTMAQETVTDREGQPVLLTQTGSHFAAIGQLTIDPREGLSAQLLTAEDLQDLTPDAQVRQLEQTLITHVEESLGQVIASLEVTLDNYDSQGNRLVRHQGTNSGEFAADALRHYFESMGIRVDVAMTNGGGIRNEALTGPVSYTTCKQIHSFGNVACLIRITGQQLLDALEWCSQGIGPDLTLENGSLMHPSGMRYTLDLRQPSTVQHNGEDVWTGPPTGDYRVLDVEILDPDTGLYAPLELDRTYTVAGYSYSLRDMGGGFAMLAGCEILMPEGLVDYLVLADYFRSFPVDPETGLPTVSRGMGYDDPLGSGRISLILPE